MPLNPSSSISQLADYAFDAEACDNFRAAIMAYTLILEKAEALRRTCVTAMLDADYNWSQISSALGITKQAAWERYSDTSKKHRQSPISSGLPNGPETRPER
ncbi:MAG: hypothetical protein ACLP41_10895 [Acidimicrobiales bacterium]